MYGTSTYTRTRPKCLQTHLRKKKPAGSPYLSFDCDIDKFNKEVYICLKRKQIYTARNKKNGKCTVPGTNNNKTQCISNPLHRKAHNSDGVFSTVICFIPNPVS
jgi:hypothetical protein